LHSENYNKGLALRIKSILSITFILLVGIIVLILSRQGLNYSSRDTYMVILTILVLLPIMLHTAIVYSISVNYYPNKEVRKRLRIVFQIVSVIAWISFALLGFGIVGLLIMIFEDEQRRTTIKENVYGIIMLVAYLLLVINIPIQLIAGYQFVARIKKNHTSFLLKSFE